MKNYINRKNIRLKNYDYSENGAYFITICVKDKREILSKIIKPNVGDGALDVPFVQLTDYGKIIENFIIKNNEIYDNIKTTKYVIMPNHLHLIVEICWSDGTSRAPSPTNDKIPAYISTLKRMSNKQIGFSIWQRSYHDHIIRNEIEYAEISQYIDTNVIKWTEDKYYTK